MFACVRRIGVNDKQTHPLLIDEKLNWNNTASSDVCACIIIAVLVLKTDEEQTHADKQTHAISIQILY